MSRRNRVYRIFPREKIHELLHRAGVEICHRPDNMVAELVALDKITTRAVQAIVNRYDIPMIPAVRIIRALTGKGVET